MDVAKIQELDRRLGKAMAAVEAKGIDAGHILHLEGKGDRVSIRWYANRHNAHAEVRELVEAFELFWQAINTA
ncbi:MAG: hypothetical protein QJR06_11140 [Alicyclobacillaceae bacterium]|nr:hypothetical protein [Alicyclobacillaceae bacterium]